MTCCTYLFHSTLHLITLI